MDKKILWISIAVASVFAVAAIGVLSFDNLSTTNDANIAAVQQQAVAARKIKPKTVADIGKLGELIPQHGGGGIHAGLVWKLGADTPKMLYYQRHSEMTPNDIAKFTDDGTDPNQRSIASYIVDKDVFPYLKPEALDGTPDIPGDGKTFNNTLRDSFKNLYYGGFRLWQGLSQSIPTRIISDANMEISQLFDPSHEDAFKTDTNTFGATANMMVHQITDSEAMLNVDAFKNAGYSAGLNYNLYCPGHSMLADGRMLAAGGHDMNSSSGLKKINIYDPEIEMWVERKEPCTRSEWEKYKFGEVAGQIEVVSRVNDPEYPDNEFIKFKKCKEYWTTDKDDPNHPTDPSLPSDMEYERWYPTVITMPNGMALILNGNDLDEKIGPNYPRLDDPTEQDSDFRGSKVIIATPEVYNPETDTVLTLENARMLTPIYGKAHIRQTGDGPDDWEVCVLAGKAAPADEASSDPARYAPDGGAEREYSTNTFNGDTYCLDVLAAMDDKKVGEPAEKFWTQIGSAMVNHDRGATSEYLKIGSNGKTEEHTVTVFGGKDNANVSTALVETITFVKNGKIIAKPRWLRREDYVQPANGTQATPLPDGTVLVLGGADSAFIPPPEDPNEPEEHVHGGKYNLEYQLFNPANGRFTPLVTSMVPRGGHANIMLTYDGTVIITGDNRHSADIMTNAVMVDDQRDPDVNYEMGDPDMGVNTLRVYRPAYLYNQDGTDATQASILRAPDLMFYGSSINVSLTNNATATASTVTLLRTGFGTHSLYTDTRLVELSFKISRDGKSLSILNPTLASQAPPGDYILFVVDESGVPSIGAHVRIGHSGIGPTELGYWGGTGPAALFDDDDED